MVHGNNIRNTATSYGEDKNEGNTPQFTSMKLTVVAGTEAPAFVMRGADQSTKARRPHPEPECNREKHVIGWKHPILTRLGPYYPLEKNHTIFPRVFLVKVLDQLKAAFRNLSMHVQYNDSPCMACCFTLDCTELYVHLWEMRDDSRSVVLEISRRSGDAIAFATYARQIIASIKALVRDSPAGGQSLVPEATPAPRHYTANSDSSCTWDKVERLIRQNPGHRDLPAESDTTAFALERAHDLLVCGRYDARRLGLESLRILTDPSKSGMAIAKLAAGAILLGESVAKEDPNPPRFYQTLQELILSLAVRGSASSQNGFHSEDQMHGILALETLANAFKVLTQSHQRLHDTKFLQSANRLAGADMLMAMLGRVAAARDQPHHAYFAAQTLTALCHMEPDVRDTLLANCASDVAQEAHHLGATGHKALESASRDLLVALRA